MQGLTSNEVEDVRPRVKYVRIGDDYHSLNPPGGETIPMVRSRAKKLLRFLLKNHAGKRILIVSHGVFLQQFHSVIRNQDWADAMADPVRVLQLRRFKLSGRELLEEAMIPLTGKEGSRW
jgi:broad specificity phosphatase PhoE